jgi:hypothetical protein
LGQISAHGAKVAGKSIVANVTSLLFRRCIDISHDLQATPHLFLHIRCFRFAKYASHKRFAYPSQRTVVDAMLLLAQNEKSGSGKDKKNTRRI